MSISSHEGEVDLKVDGEALGGAYGVAEVVVSGVKLAVERKDIVCAVVLVVEAEAAVVDVVGVLPIVVEAEMPAKSCGAVAYIIGHDIITFHADADKGGKFVDIVVEYGETICPVHVENCGCFTFIE